MTAVGAEELIVRTEEDYFNLAMRIYNNKEYLDHLKNTVKSGIKNGPLYDIKKYTNRRLYDTRTFSREAFAFVQKDPAPLVLHGMGKDAKAIKFMVNVEHDLQPQFTETVQQLEALKGPAWLMMDSKDLPSLQGTSLASLQPVLTGRFDKNDYVLLYLKPL